MMTSVDWSESGYLKVLDSLLELGFSSNIDPITASTREKEIVLRHDIDFDLEAAVAVGAMDRSRGYSSMFFVMADCEFYSISTRAGRGALEELRNQGHSVGIHWDYRNYSSVPERAKSQFQLNLSMIEQVTQERISYSSQHMPTSSVDSALLAPPSIVDMYSPLVMDNFAYISDSSMLWRSKNIFELMQTSKKIVFLAHPLWWFYPGNQANDKLQNLEAKKLNVLRASFKDFEDEMIRVLQTRKEADIQFRESRGWTQPNTL
jgi:hypothetical protein